MTKLLFAGVAFAAAVGLADEIFNGKDLTGWTSVADHSVTSERPFGEWNALEIEVGGDTLVTTLNGVVRNLKVVETR